MSTFVAHHIGCEVYAPCFLCAASTNDQSFMTIETGLSGELGYAEKWIDGYVLTEDKTVIGNFLGSLLTYGQAAMVVEPAAEHAALLSSLYFNHRQGEKLRAAGNLYWGYPCVVVNSGAGDLCFPLFYWPCRMEPAKDAVTAWELTVLQEGAFVNDFFWKNHDAEGQMVIGVLAAVCRQGLTRALSELSQRLAALPGWGATAETPVLLPLPLPGLESALEGAPYMLHWSAMLVGGNVGVQQVSTPTIDWLTPAPMVREAGHRYSFIPLDPDQAAASKQLDTQQYVLALGGGGSGKTHLIKHLIINALSNDRKVLILAPDVASLSQISNTLSICGLEQLTFTLRDANLDRHLLTSLLNRRDKRLSKQDNHDEQLFVKTVRGLQRIQERLDACFGAVRKRVFGNHSWSAAVGHYLAAAGRQSKDQLAANFQPGGLRFSPDEMNELSRTIAAAAGLYAPLMRVQPLHPSQHPLNTLHTRVFTDLTETESYAFIHGQVTYFRQKSLALHEKIVRCSSIYLEELQAYHEGHFRGLQSAFHDMEELLEESTILLGEELLKTSRPTLRLAGLFSGKCKLALSRQSAIRDHLAQLIERHQKYVGFPFEWPVVQGIERKPAVLAALLMRFSAALDNWRIALPAVIQDDVQRLNSQTALHSLSATTQIDSLEQELASLVTSINEKTLFSARIEAKMMTMPLRQKFLEELSDKLDVIHQHLDHFPAFYNWQRHWVGLNDTSRKLISALSRSSATNWVHLFESWYLNQCLQSTFDPMPPLSADALEQYVQQWEQLAKLLPSQIRYTHVQQQEKTLKKIKQLNKDLNDTDLSAKELWIRLFGHYGDALLRLFPVWLTTPKMAAQLMSATNELFDYLVIEEAHQLSENDCLPCLPIARQCLFLANPLQLGWNSQSVVKAAMAGGIQPSMLRFFHQPRVGDLAHLTLCPSGNPTGMGLQFTYVGGIYKESTGVNEAEIDYILNWLFQIEEKPQHTYPCIGIVTMTIQQRNALLGRLLRIKRERGEGVELLQQLERNGLGVYSLHEIGGQQFDTLLVSGVFSSIGWPQRLPADMAVRMDEYFLAGMAGLMAAQCQSLHIISSFSLPQLDTYLSIWDAPGMRLYAAYLRFAGSDGRQVTSKLQFIVDEYISGVVSWPLLQEVRRRSANDLQGVKINVEDHWPGNGLPMTVTRTDGSQIALNADGFWSEGSATDYYWEWQQRQRCLTAGFELQEISAQTWWKNPVAQLSNFMELVNASPTVTDGIAESD